jgi:hypothetical protein
MKDIRRWLFSALASLSTLLSAAAGVAWFECRSIGSIANAPSIQIESDPYCGIALGYKGAVFIRNLADGPERFVDWSALAGGTIYDHSGRVFFITVDYWLIIILGAAPLLWWGIRSKNRAGKRAKPGSCLHCGYDLRATPDRCPECGNVPVDAENSKQPGEAHR